MTISIGSCFTGIGGLDLAVLAAWPDATIAWHAEIDPHCRKVLALRFPGVPNLGDICAITGPPPVDVICGGFPCVDLSTAGKQAGLSGAKSSLYLELLRVATAARASALVIENVPPLIRRPDWFRRFLLDVIAGGWSDIRWGLVSAASVGAPHQRLRAFVVARHPGFVLTPTWAPVSTWDRSTDDPEPWERAVPRTIGPLRGTHRGARLRALGNAVVPQAGVQALCAAESVRIAELVPYGRVNMAEDFPDSGRLINGEVWATESWMPHCRHSDLTVAVRQWPTPLAQDAEQNGSPSRYQMGRHPLNAAAQAVPGQGRLNPDWVELLMGYPLGWSRP